MKPLTTLDQLDEMLIVLAQSRTCSACRGPAFTATPRQPLLGRHLSCMDIALSTELQEQAHLRAETLCMDAFPGALVTFGWQPTTLAPDTYGGVELLHITGVWRVSGRHATCAVWVSVRDAGPCTRCHRTIRRYGPFGVATCKECEGNP
jgi:hypothetical protein